MSENIMTQDFSPFFPKPKRLTKYWLERYWCDVLFEKCCRIIEWDGLEAYNVPQIEVELMLMKYGHFILTRDSKWGMVAVAGSMHGCTPYVYQFKKYTYAATGCDGGTRTMDKDCVLFQNTSMRTPIVNLVQRYAALLAHADLSLQSALINLRAVDVYSAENEASAESVRSVLNSIEQGKPNVIVDKNLLSEIKNVANTRPSNSGVKDSIEAQEDILRNFYRDIGIRSTKDKKERMLENEITSDEQLLLFNIGDMLNTRRESAEKAYKIFGKKLTPKLSKEFELITEGVYDEQNDSKTISTDGE